MDGLECTRISCRFLIQILLFLLTFMIISTVSGYPLRWRNMQLDVNVSINDPGWQDLILWSTKAVSEAPRLTWKTEDQCRLETPEISWETEETSKLAASRKEEHGTLPELAWRMLGSVYIKKLLASAKTQVSCTVCKAGVGFILSRVRREDSTAQSVIDFAKKLCINLRIKSSEACEGIMRMYGDRVVHVLKNIPLKEKHICSFVDACGEVSNPTHEWEVDFVPVPKRAVIEHDPIEVDRTSLKVLQISDTHLDLHYAEGSSAKCDEEICCREFENVTPKSYETAGRWGDYRKCDIPQRTLDNMLQHISQRNQDIDYILWTGDLNPHDLWRRTREENLTILRQTVTALIEHFPGIPIFPALGNHDSFPPYGFPSPSIQLDKEYTNDWMYEELRVQWENWLPNTASTTILRGAFYSVLIKPGFRIISLNMNYCLKKNWWLLMDSKDPAYELQWLIYELQSAEFSLEKVHIIGHIPPGDSDCLKVWSHNYYRIVARYESTISAQFFGHTHYDEFELFYDPQDLSRPVNIAYIGPSVTTYIGLNPGYKIYYIDGDREDSTRTVLDYETWVMNLDDANQSDNPVWYKLYSAKDAYELPNLMPHAWHNLVIQLEENEELFYSFYKRYWKNSSARPLCDAKCKKELICNLRSGRSHDRKTFCHRGMKKIEEKPAKKTSSKLRRMPLPTCARCYSDEKDDEAPDTSND